MNDDQKRPEILPEGPHVHMNEQFDLAKNYAEDGGFRSTANVLRRLADRIDEHIDACEIEMAGKIISRAPPPDGLGEGKAGCDDCVFSFWGPRCTMNCSPCMVPDAQDAA